MLLVLLLAASACSPGSTTTAPAPASTTAGDPSTSSTTAVEASGAESDRDRSQTTTPLEYLDGPARAFMRQMNEPRPVENSAMPPRHWDPERFPEILVERTEILPGGPPPDGIPSIDTPSAVPVERIDWLDDAEAVIVVSVGESTRIYPIQVLIWHEIVNDELGDVPITVTYCPLCNSAVVFEREIDGRLLDFGTSGYLYQSSLVMYDRQTESLWTHFDGRSVVGTLIGTELPLVPASTMSWADAIAAFPDATVLERDTVDPKPYGRNRYAGYDQADAPLTGWFTNREVSDRLALMTRVIGIRRATPLAVPLDLAAERGVIPLDDGAPLVVFWSPGTNSPLQDDDVAGGDDIGATGVFSPIIDGRELTFTSDDGVFTDAQTGSSWSIAGTALTGPLAGRRLTPVEHLDTFWFAWATFEPETTIVG